MLILPALAPHVARSAGDAPSAEHTLAGQLLVASPEIGDPRFAHTVILIVHHDEGGAFGIVINRPVEERSFESLLEAIGDNGKGVEGSVRIFSGIPWGYRSRAPCHASRVRYSSGVIPGGASSSGYS